MSNLKQLPYPLLPHNLRGGAHVDLFAPHTVTFVLTAPFKPYVALVGDFNGWDTRTNRMVTDGSGLWWTTIPHPGATRYGFYVAIDQDSHAWIGDPYATQVVWDEPTPWGWLPVPSAPPFAWKDANWRTPPLRDLAIYELCVRDFAGGWVADQPHYGALPDLLSYVDYLVALGVNAVELMPIQAFPGNSSWGYNPVFYFAIANSYGRPDDLKRLVDACHARGLAVILDVAFNHAWSQQPYYHIYPPLYGPKGEWLADWNPFFHQTPAAINGWGGLDWDHFSPVTTHYFQDVVRFWLREYHVDGFRFDWVGGVEYDSRAPQRADFDPYHGMHAIGWAARQEKPDCLLIGEYWQLEGTNPAKSAARLVQETPMDACWNDQFHHIVDEVLNQRWEWEKRDIYQALAGYREQGFTSAAQTVNYSCSHDEVRPEHEIKFYSGKHITRPRGWSLDQVARAKGLLGLIALFTAPGVPLLWQGQEFAEDGARTIDFQPLDWAKLREPAHAAHYKQVVRLLHARRAHAALRSEHLAFFSTDFVQDKLVAFRRWANDASIGEQVVVALNFDHRQQRITLPFPHNGPWREVVQDQGITVRNGAHSVRLGPWQGAVFVG